MTLTAPVLCLVTDRRRLGARLGSAPDTRTTADALLSQVTAAAEAGVGLIQVREVELPDATLVALVRAIRDRVVPYGARVVVNDRLDIALASGADGVHLKSASISVIEALRLAPSGWLIGRSIHALAEIERGVTTGAHYLIFGSVFPTQSKPAGWETTGLAGLEAAVRAASPVPVLGIGGIGLAQAPAVAATGAAGLAAIDAFLPPQSTGIADNVQEVVRRMRMAFDSSLPLS